MFPARDVIHRGVFRFRNGSRRFSSLLSVSQAAHLHSASTFSDAYIQGAVVFPRRDKRFGKISKLCLRETRRLTIISTGSFLTFNSLSYSTGGNVAAIVVGGAAEAFNCRPRQYKLVLKKRKGFCKVALQNGSPLVPVFSFGETDLFDQVQNPEGSTIRKIQEWLKKRIGLAPAIPLGRGIFQYNYGIVPHRRPVTTVGKKSILSISLDVFTLFSCSRTSHRSTKTKRADEGTGTRVTREVHQRISETLWGRKTSLHKRCRWYSSWIRVNDYKLARSTKIDDNTIDWLLRFTFCVILNFNISSIVIIFLIAFYNKYYLFHHVFFFSL